MTSANSSVQEFLGGDPIAGNRALHALLALGAAGEEALFSQRINHDVSVQVRRRWLKFVAARDTTVVARLLARLQDQRRYYDSDAAAFLFAGLGDNGEAIHALQAQLGSVFSDGGPALAILDTAPQQLLAWGYAGGPADALWHYVSKDHFRWEKLASGAFSGACASLARRGPHAEFVIRQMITHEWRDSGLAQISDTPAQFTGSRAVSDQELWAQSCGTFAIWRHGEVADKILRHWSGHTHWRVREFGAQVLAGLGFQRTATPIIEWLAREPIQSVRRCLQTALATSETPAGAEVLLARFEAHEPDTSSALARVAWRANDKNRALTVLQAIAQGEDPVATAEAVVSLSRLGHHHPRLGKLLDADRDYCRLNAGLALAYLGDKSALSRLIAMQQEAATAMERVFLAAATAMLGKPHGAIELHAELVRAASARELGDRIDIYFLHGYLQAALFEGLAAGGPQSERCLSAWRAELVPLPSVHQPITATPSSSSGVSSPIVAARLPRDGGGGSRLHEAPERPLKVFLSYSRKDDKMRLRLIEHLAPLVDEGAILIWHDLMIEAGADWDRKITDEIVSADLVLLLVSASFLNSRWCRDELLRAIEQRGTGNCLPIPIIMRDCDWMNVFNNPQHRMQALPRSGRPVADRRWTNQDAALAEVARELRAVIERLRHE